MAEFAKNAMVASGYRLNHGKTKCILSPFANLAAKIKNQTIRYRSLDAEFFS